MLVLSRKVGESVVVMDDIVITVIEVHKDRVRLGIDAPPHIPINRKEVWLEMQGKKQGEE